MQKYGLVDRLHRLNEIYDYIAEPKNQAEFKKFANQYQQGLLNGKVYPRYELLPKALADKSYYWNWAETDYHFWLRRELDGTKPLWAKTVKYLLELYT